jgi:hypothetical protein
MNGNHRISYNQTTLSHTRNIWRFGSVTYESDYHIVAEELRPLGQGEPTLYFTHDQPIPEYRRGNMYSILPGVFDCKNAIDVISPQPKGSVYILEYLRSFVTGNIFAPGFSSINSLNSPILLGMTCAASSVSFSRI